jgi:hypothetical protein
VEILILQVFVSLLLVVGSVVLFGYTCRQRSFDHVDRLALLPLDDEAPALVPAPLPAPHLKGTEGNES